MLTPFDDYPVHQTSRPLAHAADGHPDHYDRFWFNGYTEDSYFALAMGIYPNRGVIDAAFSVVHDGVQRSVFASGRVPADRTQTRVGPITVDIVEPLRVNRITIDAPEHGLRADLTYRARTGAYEESPQIMHSGSRLVMDSTRATQLGTWTGTVNSGTSQLVYAAAYGTKDRSWGIRPVGAPTPTAPMPGRSQVFFLWAPLHFDDLGLHHTVFEDESGARTSSSSVLLPLLTDGEPVVGEQRAGRAVSINHEIDWAPGQRLSTAARLDVEDPHTAGTSRIELEPLLTFRMKGAGYLHPTWGHGHWRGELEIGGEEAAVADLDHLSFETVHVQQVVRARWGTRDGLGVLEQLAIGPHAPSGFTDLLDGARR